jgi:hypothetical protein
VVDSELRKHEVVTAFLFSTSVCLLCVFIAGYVSKNIYIFLVLLFLGASKSVFLLAGYVSKNIYILKVLLFFGAT